MTIFIPVNIPFVEWKATGRIRARRHSGVNIGYALWYYLRSPEWRMPALLVFNPYIDTPCTYIMRVHVSTFMLTEVDLCGGAGARKMQYDTKICAYA